MGIIRRLFRADMHLTFDLADPLPAVAMHLRIWKNVIRQARSMFHRLPAQKDAPQLSRLTEHAEQPPMTSAAGAHSTQTTHP
jgi:hypothetical protein